MPFDDENTFYRQLESELAPQLGLLFEASDTIVNQEVSDYPVMIVAKEELEFGIPVFDTRTSSALWNVNAATLEVLHGHGIIEQSKLENFRQLYKKRQPALCLLVMYEAKANFVFWKRNDA